VQVVAKDLGNPQQTSEEMALVTVAVDRNKNSPKLVSKESTRITINENSSPGSEIFRFDIEDADEVVSCANNKWIILLFTIMDTFIF
jgi:hypothetical protein